MSETVGLRRNAIGVIGHNGFGMLFRQIDQEFRCFGQLLCQGQQVVAHDGGAVGGKHVLT